MVCVCVCVWCGVCVRACVRACVCVSYCVYAQYLPFLLNVDFVIIDNVQCLKLFFFPLFLQGIALCKSYYHYQHSGSHLLYAIVR